MKLKLFLITLFISCFYFISFSQKIFEGKVYGEIIRENVPENMKAYVKNSTSVSYYKKNKLRYESRGDKSYTVVICDYAKGKQLVFLEMNIGGKITRTATISDIPISDVIENNEKIEEYKTIAGHKCQRVNASNTMNGKVYKSTSYFCDEYKMNGRYNPSGPTYISMGFETAMEIEGQGTMIMRTTSISEEPVSDELFSLTPPAGYVVKDQSKNPGSAAIQEAAWAANDFDKLSDSELKKKIEEALAKEDFETAQAIKGEVDMRIKAALGKYGQYSNPELKKMLDDAVNKEDFTTAQELKKELDRRPK